MITLFCEIRPLGNSMSHKVPVTVIVDSGANSNIIGGSIAKIVGLKIDTEIYSPISELKYIGNNSCNGNFGPVSRSEMGASKSY